jgi:hypothetical protein
MTKPKTTLAPTLALAAILGGAGACADTGGGEPVENLDPVEAAIAELGTPIVGCDTTAAQNAALVLTVSDVPLVLSAPSGVITANGIGCVRTSARTPLKTTDITSITINGDGNDNKVILDFLPGSFGTKIFGVTAAGIKVDFSLGVSANDDKDSLMIRAGATAESYKFASKTNTMAMPPAVTDVYIEATGDKIADIDVVLPPAGGKLSLTSSMGGGADTVSASPAGSEIDRWSGEVALGAGNTLGPMPATLGITAYGGPGDDKFTGGLGDDSFFGGEGSDTFRMSATADGADIYSGDDDLDTVEYSDRTLPLFVDLGPERPGVEGAVDLRNPALYGANGILAGKSLQLIIDGTRIAPIALSAAISPVPMTGPLNHGPDNPKELLTMINDAVNTALSTTGVVYATLTAKNHLAITSNTAATVSRSSMVKVEDAMTITAAANAAETALGLSSPAMGVTTATGVDLTTLTYGGGMGTLDGTRLLMRLSGVYVVVDFVAPANIAEVLSTINTAANLALGTSRVVNAAQGTTGVTYASRDAATNKLVITAPKIEILPGTNTFSSTNQAGCLLGFCSRFEGTIDLTTVTASTVDSNVLDVIIDGARVVTTFSATAVSMGTVVNPTTVATQINTAANTALGTTGVAYASIAPTTNHLVLSSNKDSGGVQGIYFLDYSAVAAATGMTVDAAPVLGLTGSGSKLVSVELTPSASFFGMTGALADARLNLTINGRNVLVALTAPADTAALATAINTAANTALGTIGVVYASQTTKKNKLQLAAGWITVNDGVMANTMYTSASPLLGFANPNLNTPASTDISDTDDGLPGERDDVRWSTENITGGKSNDMLIGNRLKNTIKGGTGNDTISGGPSAATCTLADSDTLAGEDGNDTFLMPTFNCKAALNGGTGENTADFSGRTTRVMLKNNGSADDGEYTESGSPLTQTTTEGVNIASDIKTLIGGYGADYILGGATNEIIVGGPGADRVVGGAGSDTIDYSGSPRAVTVSLCVTTAESSCPTANDGTAAVTATTTLAAAAAEGDQVFQVEHVVGSAYDDTISQGGAAMGSMVTVTSVELLLEGGSGDDVLTGGDVNDEIWGDEGDDDLHGGKGDDLMNGGAGNDNLEGGLGDADICLGDGADLIPQTTCELNTP